jgi:hypothetical protein
MVPMTSIRRALGASLLLAAAVLTGCAQVPMGTPVASLETIQAARSIGMAPVAVGEFKLSPGKNPSLDKSLSIRASGVSSPFDASFARYLQETLRAELKAAGLEDPASETSIRGLLTDNQVDSGIGQGSGSLAARFIVERAGHKVVYDKELKVEATWDSSFVGAVAIPTARNEYSLLYRKLVRALLADADFRSAVVAHIGTGVISAPQPAGVPSSRAASAS